MSKKLPSQKSSQKSYELPEARRTSQVLLRSGKLQTNVELTPYEGESSILEKWAEFVGASDGTEAIPSYFRLVDLGTEFQNSKSFELFDIRKELKGLSAEQLIESLPNFSINYPRLSRRSILLLWITANDKKTLSDRELDFLRPVDPGTFSISQTAINSAIFAEDDAVKTRRALLKNVENAKTAYRKLEKLEDVAAGDFVTEEASFLTAVKPSKYENLYDIFDAMNVSVEIPFIVLVDRLVPGMPAKIFPKTSTQILPHEKWVEEIDKLPSGIHFKILNDTSDRIFQRLHLMLGLYSDGFWSPENHLEVAFKLRKTEDGQAVTEKNMLSIVQKSFGDRLKYSLGTSRQTGVKGIFEIPFGERSEGRLDSFNRVIFSDMIANDSLFSFFTFANEAEATLLNKERYHIYLTPDQKGIPKNSLGVLITPEGTEDKGGSVTQGKLIVRISHARSTEEAQATSRIIRKLFAHYIVKRDGIEKIYSNIFPKFSTVTVTKSKKSGTPKEDKKSGVRRLALGKIDPVTFGNRYPDQCQRHQMPVVLTEAQARKLQADLGAEGKAMFYEGRWYGCDPRETTDKDLLHLWPGLKPNTSKDEKFRTEVPFLPCCYKSDQTTKKSSTLYKYMHGGAASIISKKVPQSGLGYVLGSSKSIPPGRYGDLPYNWVKLLGLMKIPKITRGKQEAYPYLRHGVLESPASFVDCLLRTKLGPSSGLETEGDSTLQSTRVKIAASVPSILYGKQELYDYSVAEVQNLLRDPEAYLAPEDFVSVMEHYFELNIFLYEISATKPLGEIVIPRSSGVYFPRPFDPSKPTVFVVKQQTEGANYPYQCEIFCDLSVRGARFTFDAENPLVQMAIDLFNAANKIYITSAEGAEKLGGK